ncbi:MAG: Maf family nucleotide pyrophosphatase [Candidatus Omnitrophica bacterium]|nr:Maf family nucleotide pyrophosphatase [Candidatus Omnitrophota bacterium]MDD5500913.1 Maf family nucleotide pyrophosphatase [Candidatus Omnitrophota bacterium]
MKIYLASKSKARKELLRRLGLKFEVIRVDTDEAKERGGLSYPRMVEENARRKAESAAAKIKEGIVIAADTLCVQGRTIFGKPGNIQDAGDMLKKLSRRPHRLFTGLAVARKKGGRLRMLLGHEETRVFMDKLDKAEISAYFKNSSPLDKAGSFDIQGKGAFFIRKIDGCFYNVVGLPLRRLRLMLGKLNLRVFMHIILPFSCVLALSFLAGCSTEYNLVTKQEEKYYYSTDSEVKMGRSIDLQVQRLYKSSPDPLQQKRVEDIGAKIAAVSDRKEIDYHFRVLEDDQINAVSLPGGYVYVNSGLVDKAASDDELACVLAHEVGHIVARHSIKKLQATQGYTVLRLLAAVTPGVSEVGTAADAAFTQFMLGYSREDELLADQLGARYARLAGYDPRGMITFLTKLQEINRRSPIQPRSYYKTHPYVPDRIRVVKQELGEQMDFDDYINIEQEPHK